MKKIVFGSIILLVFVIFLALESFSKTKNTSSNYLRKSATISSTNKMKITSAAFTNHENIPAKYTCTGENRNPPLEFLDVPQQTKSLVLIMDDPDAPGGTWVHWIVFNMNPHEKGLKETTNSVSGIEGMTSFGKPGYGGPCPPSGVHRYFFKLYALDAQLGLSENSDKKQVEKAIQGHVIESAELVGLYSKD